MAKRESVGLAAAAVMAWTLPALAQDKVVLAPHRAIYDLTLDSSKPSKSIDGAKGRIAFDFGGDACEGYTLSFRQVTQLQTSESGQRVIDARTTSFEAGDGSSYRFKTESSASGAPAEVVDGIATREGQGFSVKLTQPKPGTHREEMTALFPNAQMKAVIAAAKAGQTTYNVRLYDGANTGRDVYDTFTVIGRKIETAATEEPLKRPELDKLARWPVTMSYFKVGSGETTPAYTIAFDLYENGITGQIRLDYGSFALRGTMTTLDLRPASSCDR